MNDRLLFELLARLSQEHAAARPGELRIVPILLDGIAEVAGLFDAFARHLGGVFLDVTGTRFDGATPSRADDPELRAHLEGSLRVRRAGALHHIELTVDAGTVDAAYMRDGSPQIATGGWQAALAVSRALFAAELEHADAAVLSYVEAELDVRLRGRLLHAFCDLETLRLNLGGVRTLFVVAETPSISVGTHCQPGRGVRYALLEDGLQHRRPLDQLRASVGRFAQPRDKPVVLFLGAGFSASSHLPMGNELRNDAIGRICGMDPDTSTDRDLAEAFWAFAETYRLLLPPELDAGREAWVERLTLEHVVRIESEHFHQAVPQTIEDFAERHDDIVRAGSVGDAVAALRNLVARRARLILVTVNFDELVEQPADDLDIAVTPADFDRLIPKLEALVHDRDPGDDRVPYLKLHGTISDRPSCVASDRQTLSGLDRAKRAALNALVSDLGGDPLLWVYVGASMRDLDLRPVFEMREFHEDVEEYWATPHVERSVRQFAELRRHSWPASRGLEERMITEVADAFVTVLDELWPS